MKKALIIATVAGFIASFELQDIDILQSLGFEVHCATNLIRINDLNKKQILLDTGIVTHQIDFERSPISLKNVKAYKQLLKLINDERFDLVHCHTPVGGVLGRIAARKCGVKNILYSAHGFHFYKGAPFINWLFYYNVEKSLSKKTDILITINNEDYVLAKNKFKAKNIKKIHGVGIDTTKFTTPKINKDTKRTELGIKPDEKMLLSVGELSKDKNHISSIKAMRRLASKGYKLFIAGEGKQRKVLERYISKYHLQNNVSLLGYRKDISELLYSADLFLFPSLFEGLSVALMEAIASRVPVICSKVRGNVDLIITPDLYFNPKSSKSIEFSVETLFKTPKNDIEKLIEKNYQNLKQYDINNVRFEMSNIYKSIIEQN